MKDLIGRGCLGGTNRGGANKEKLSGSIMSSMGEAVKRNCQGEVV